MNEMWHATKFNSLKLQKMNEKSPRKREFIDLFSGCGGLSLGLVQAGWQGTLAIEKSSDAFLTFAANFLNGPSDFRFQWPTWLEAKENSIDRVLASNEINIQRLRGVIDLIAGGPPCQGFSMAGKRRKADPRNLLFQKYVQFVSDVLPKAILVENVPGMKIAHGKAHRRANPKPGPVPKSYYEKLISALSRIGYTAVGHVLDAADFGVPQRRPRLIVIGLRNDVVNCLPGGIESVFVHVDMSRVEQLRVLGLSESMSARDAISDLEVGKRDPIPYDSGSYRRGFFAPAYRGPKTKYQVLMHEGFDDQLMDSIRLASHTEKVKRRFETILRNCRKGVTLSEEDRKRLGMSKHRTFVMDPDKPAPTVTTLPDDVLHYKEPRILSVRESARIQSFPDWFKFRGKYTTGGERRVKECPRYTQVGNAVPPLMARALGLGISSALKSCERSEQDQSQKEEIGSVGNRAVAVI